MLIDITTFKCYEGYLMTQLEMQRIKEWKDRLSKEDLELFYLVTRLAREYGIRQARPRDVLDMD